MFGWHKCGACGRRFRPDFSRRTDICPDCVRSRIRRDVLTTAEPVSGTSELDEVERRVHEAKLAHADERAHLVDSMEEQVAQWQRLNGILNAPPGTLSPQERAKYERMRDELRKGPAVSAFLRDQKRRQRRDRERGGL